MQGNLQRKAFRQSNSVFDINSITFQVGNFVLERKNSIMEHYDKMEVIGIGSFGKVYKVQHIITKKIYAAKIISKINYEGSDDVISEINVLKSLVYINII